MQTNLFLNSIFRKNRFGVFPRPNVEIAPYIAAREIGNASKHLLDTINNSLSEEIKGSLYGKALQEIISSRKTD